MILTAAGKEVQFWVHLDNPGSGLRMESASTSGRPPLPHQSHAALLRAASSFKEKSPAIYRNLSADGTRIYDSIQHPPEEKSSVEPPSSSSSLPTPPSSSSSHPTPPPPSSSLPTPPPSSSSPPAPSSSSAGRIQYPSLQESLSSKQPTHPSSSSSQPRSIVNASAQSSSSSVLPPAPPPLISRALPPLLSLPALKKTNECNTRGRKETVDTWDGVFFQGINTDVTLYTNDGYQLHAHSMVLMCSSPVLKSILKDEFRRSTHAFINIRGVPFQALRCFVRFLYSSRCEEDDVEMFAIHLLVLAHAYTIPALKRFCTDSFQHGLLNSENVVDVLQVARLCDASRLQLLCLRRIVSEFKTVARSEAWRIMKESDPTLEQELVEAVVEAETIRRDRVRKREEDKVYSQLHDAMEALVHICRDGCRSIGPHDKALGGGQAACSFPACRGLESLVRHFAACKLKVSGGCVHCKRMWQLLELHSRMCTLQDSSCKVPLCRHFKERVGQQPNRKEELRWKMLVRKVQSSAKAASGSFSLLAVSARLSQVN